MSLCHFKTLLQIFRPNGQMRYNRLRIWPSLSESSALVSTTSSLPWTDRFGFTIPYFQARLVQSNRTLSGGGGLGRANTTSSTASSLTSRTISPSSKSPSSASSFKKPPPPPPGSFNKETSMPPPPYTVGNGVGASGIIGKKPPPPPPVKPKPKTEPRKQRVIALYDFEAQADGDLTFKAGDLIEVVEKTPSSEDWWTGKINGVQGVFPGRHLSIRFGCSTKSSTQVTTSRMLENRLWHHHLYCFATRCNLRHSHPLWLGS